MDRPRRARPVRLAHAGHGDIVDPAGDERGDVADELPRRIPVADAAVDIGGDDPTGGWLARWRIRRGIEGASDLDPLSWIINT